MAKMGFYYNQAGCSGCRTCQVACKDKNDLDIGILFRHVNTYQVGKYPTASMYNYAATCNHCESPMCVAVCSTGALYIDDEDGTVQLDSSKCDGCQACVEQCPYGVPQFNEELNVAMKCDACIQLREAGEDPACVAACPMRALEFGPIEDLRKAHPDAVSDIAILPDSSGTKPCTIIDVKASALEKDYEEIWL